MFWRLLHSENVLQPISVTPAGIAISRRLLQPLKAPEPMLSIFDGRRISVRPEQPSKALLPRIATLSGSVTLSSPVQ